MKRYVLAIALFAAFEALAQNAVKFRSAGASAGVADRYQVRLALEADEDPEAVARQLASTYGVHLAENVSAAGTELVVVASEAKARLLSTDRRVALVERAPEANGRPTDVTTHAPGGFGAYSYDGAGNVASIGSDSFIYDAFGRIDSATVSGTTQDFTYDRHGNITNIVTTTASGASTNDIAIGTGNRLSRATYDGSGNLRSYHGGTFEYDGLNMVTESTPTGGNRRVYIYTASNERIATIEVLPDGKRRTDWTIRDTSGKVLRRYRTHPNGAWSWEEDYIYRGSHLLAAEVPTPEKVRFFHLDHLGTPRLITGNGGAKLSERAYGAFGQGFTVVTAQQVTPEPNEAAQFTGHERDNFQLDYMHARYYDPIDGRFLSCDPVLDIKRATRQPQAWNRYSYTINNPVNRIDPDGRIDDAIGPAMMLDCQTNGCRPDAAADEETARFLGSTSISAIPYVGDAYDALTAITGRDLITQQKIPAWARVAGVMVPFLGSGLLGKLSSGTTTLVIGKVADLRAPGALKTGETTLLDSLPNLGNPRANWKQNTRALREAMRTGRPIRDASVDPVTGELKKNDGFLRAERNLLETQGWWYDKATRMWYPPK